MPGQPQHVIVRGNNREPIFWRDEDYRFYLEKLGQACEKYQCDLHAYVLMTNHVHLLLTPGTEQSIGKTLQMLGRYYVQYVNHKYQRTGTLWEGRYKATLVDSERYLLTCYRYIELNPVRCGLVGHPSDYPWSSYHCNGLGHTNELVKPHRLYMRLSSQLEARREAYRALFETRIEDQTLAEIREATNKAWVLGSGHFKQQIKPQLNRRVEPVAKGGDRKSKVFRQLADIN